MRASVSMRVRVRACACACARACARAQPNGDAARRGPRRGWEQTPQPCVRRRQSRNPRPRPRRRPHRDRHSPRGTPVTRGGGNMRTRALVAHSACTRRAPRGRREPRRERRECSSHRAVHQAARRRSCGRLALRSLRNRMFTRSTCMPSLELTRTVLACALSCLGMLLRRPNSACRH